MATILDTQKEVPFFLREHHTFGRRSDHVDTFLHDDKTSRIQAVIEWDGGCWQIRDLSKNGTWLDGVRLNANEAFKLQEHAEIRFGSTDSAPWKILDLAAPDSLLLPVEDGHTPVSLELFTLLPDDNPTHAFHYSEANKGWMCTVIEEPSRETLLTHNSLVIINGVAYRVFLAESGRVTQKNTGTHRMLSDCEFIFQLSSDEEITELKILEGRKIHHLGERSHHYVLAHLARLKAEASDSGISGPAQGWTYTDDLARDLGVDSNHLNILIFRARKQIADKLSLTDESNSLLERKKGRIRFGSAGFQIHKGGAVICRMTR